MYTMLRDSNPIAAKISLDVMVELYKRNIWWVQSETETLKRLFYSQCIIILFEHVFFFVAGMIPKQLMLSQLRASPKWQRYILGVLRLRPRAFIVIVGFLAQQNWVGEPQSCKSKQIGIQRGGGELYIYIYIKIRCLWYWLSGNISAYDQPLFLFRYLLQALNSSWEQMKMRKMRVTQNQR